MTSKTIVLQGSSSPLSDVDAHLMPFHINHTGPASLSTYFLVKPSTPASEEPNEDTVLQRVKSRFTAAFRGRKMHGLKVDVPEGYTGIILEATGEGSSTVTAIQKRPVSPKKSTIRGGRTTRGSRTMEDDADDDDFEAEEMRDEDTAGPIRTLHATGKFTSFILWNPDVEVDEGQDEYLRSLTEYRTILSELHRTDM
ncbi:hypothetical protein M422DRAFT_199768 [Sphaerobolus stellatus SS14]|nr:hypothetical protein M422DRAFT_199768 [Sphaerobolus stellatus SS14]